MFYFYKYFLMGSDCYIINFFCEYHWAISDRKLLINYLKTLIDPMGNRIDPLRI